MYRQEAGRRSGLQTAVDRAVGGGPRRGIAGLTRRRALGSRDVENWQLVAAGGVVAALGLISRIRRTAKTSKPKVGRRRGRYPGDYQGRVTLEYSPDLDGSPDPGEVVWTWVPFEEDHSKGKDRPVLLIGRDGKWLLGLMLTSKDHDHDRFHRERWMDIGTGPWDRQRRPSEVRLDRIIRINPRTVRREGAIIAKPTFDAVAGSLSALHHW